MQRAPSLLVTILAILKSGLCLVAIYESQPAERLQGLLPDATRLLPHKSEYDDEICKLSWQTNYSHRAMSRLSLVLVMICCYRSGDNHLLYEFIHRGSTGKPKASEITKNLLNYVCWFAEYSRCNQQDASRFFIKLYF